MIIGLDLDNTLVSYEAAFLAASKSFKESLPSTLKTKNQIRDFIRKLPNGEHSWQKLQGLTYGNYVLSHASLYPGVKRFLWRCKQRGYRVKIVSHKTKYGHYDIKNIPLRQVALDFLSEQGLLNSENPLIQDVVFMSTREEKVECIRGQYFDWFVDDLPSVINDLNGVSGLNTILFDSIIKQTDNVLVDTESTVVASDWQQIDTMINKDWTISEVHELLQQVFKLKVADIDKVSVGGNAAVFRLTLPDNTFKKLKIYPVDINHDRLRSEYMATKYLSELGCKNIPLPFAQNTELGIGIYEWVEGEPVISPDQEDLESSLELLESLHSKRDASQFSNMPLASAACLSGDDIEKQINHRLNHFELAKGQYPELNGFLLEEFIPTFKKLLSWAKDNWPEGTDFSTPIPRAEQTLSPSDFGFHNAIRQKDNSLVFIDFEYFGWDDPVKLISDFTFHQGMNLTKEQKSIWQKEALKIYGEKLSERLWLCRPLYGLIWCLIILNDYRQDIWHRRLLADETREISKAKILDRQMLKAKNLLQDIRLNYIETLTEYSH